MLFGQIDVFESLQLLARELQRAGQCLNVKHGALGSADIHHLWGIV
jgi:hypothetical protein